MTVRQGFRQLIVVGLLVGVLVVIAASPGAAATPAVAADDSAQSFTKLTSVDFFDTDTLDPALAYNSAALTPLGNIYDRLVTAEYTDPATILPSLATGWTVSADGLTYTFTIRQGVGFHHGAILTPSDVAYSLQRGMLQSDPVSPQWTIIGPVMGYSSGDITKEIGGGAFYGDPEGLVNNANPAELLATCNSVKEHVRADDAAGTVTITLAEPNGAFLNILGQYGHVLERDWAAAQGDWNGDCATWQHFYAPGAEGSKLTTKASGTGPYRLQAWTPDVVTQLRRFAPYWGGWPSVPVALEEVELRHDATGPDEVEQMLLDGRADLGSTFGASDALAAQVRLSQDVFAGGAPQVGNPAGSLLAYGGQPSPVIEVGVFQYNIVSDAEGNFIGSGQLDGNGIPPNFFTDIHVRRAFSYAFDYAAYDAFNEDFYGGPTIRATGPIPKPLMGYDPAQSPYAYDPVLAMQEFSQAWGGQVVANGFRMTIGYDEGNSVRELFAQTIKTGIEALSPNFHVDVVEMPWGDFLPHLRSGRLPLYTTGWISDYPHPDNYVTPILASVLPSRQQLPESMRSVYEAKAAECLAMLAPGARACYESLQNLAYQDAVDIFLSQSTFVDYVRAEVRGYGGALSPFGWLELGRLWKTTPPAVVALQPAAAAEAGLSSAAGPEVALAFPSGAVTEPQQIIFAVDPSLSGKSAPTGQMLGGASFSLTAAETGSRAAQEEQAFVMPVMATVAYGQAEIAPLLEDTLVLLYWNGSQWEPAACGAVAADPAANTLVTPICQTGLYALAGETYSVGLPVITR